MEIGMLWFDDGPKTVNEKVGQAVAFYTDKFGRKPTHCLVHPTTLDGSEGLMGGVMVRAARNVMPHHYWIGIDEEQTNRTPKKTSRPTAKTDRLAVQGQAA